MRIVFSIWVLNRNFFEPEHFTGGGSLQLIEPSRGSEFNFPMAAEAREYLKMTGSSRRSRPYRKVRHCPSLRRTREFRAAPCRRCPHSVRRAARAFAVDTVCAGRRMFHGRGAGGPKPSKWVHEGSKRFGAFFSRRSGVVEPLGEAADASLHAGPPDETDSEPTANAAAGGQQPVGADVPMGEVGDSPWFSVSANSPDSRLACAPKSRFVCSGCGAAQAQSANAN